MLPIRQASSSSRLLEQIEPPHEFAETSSQASTADETTSSSSHIETQLSRSNRSKAKTPKNVLADFGILWRLCGIDGYMETNNRDYVVTAPKNHVVAAAFASPRSVVPLTDTESSDDDEETGIYLRTAKVIFCGSEDELHDFITVYNEANQGVSKIVMYGAHTDSLSKTEAQLGVYSQSLDECYSVLTQLNQ